MNPLLALAIRHGVSALGAALVAKGAIPAESVAAAATATETLFGSLVFFGGLFMSYRDKRKNGII